ncbi:cytochrome c oxidase assembly protein [Rhizobium sp. Rhizsp42]|jgi:cytochrome c oxidase assembly factor CtaG|uniref:cytochrome c oxidase assembly protein n=1 Tax=Rhizobium sp. Rhizsp42 TaxID=3243034 RepID=UPI0039B09129
MRTLIAFAVLIAVSGNAFAHGGETHARSYPWTFDPLVIVPICVAATASIIGSRRLLKRVCVNRRSPVLRILAFHAGLISLAAALISPIHWLGEHLFAVHMIEHEIVMAVSAPLIVLSRPAAFMVWSLPRAGRLAASRMFNAAPLRVAWTSLTGGLLATLLHGAAIWVWHAPVLLDTSIADTTAHRAQHLTFFITAIFFWWAMIWRSERGVAAWHLFVTMMHTSVLGALIALSPRVLYVAQTADAREWGISPLQDQQMAGLLMWIPAGTVYAGAAIFLLSAWIKQSSTRIENA